MGKYEPEILFSTLKGIFYLFEKSLAFLGFLAFLLFSFAPFLCFGFFSVAQVFELAKEFFLFLGKLSRGLDYYPYELVPLPCPCRRCIPLSLSLNTEWV